MAQKVLKVGLQKNLGKIFLDPINVPRALQPEHHVVEACALGGVAEVRRALHMDGGHHVVGPNVFVRQVDKGLDGRVVPDVLLEKDGEGEGTN